MEPVFEESIDGNYAPPPATNTTSGPVFAVKEDNVTSEQTFMVTFNSGLHQDTYPSADRNYDYAQVTFSESVVVQFLFSKQRIAFPFILFADNIAERTEAFLTTLAPENSAQVNGVTFVVPSFLPPVKLSSRALIKIVDNDRKFPLYKYYNYAMYYTSHHYCSAIIVGFQQTMYTVTESIGTLEVVVRVCNPPFGFELFISINLVIQTISINASECF